MKTKFEFITDYSHETMQQYKKGDKGYIDGYINGGNGRPLMVIVVGEVIDLIPFHNLIKIIP
jgi:hypothetical protein